MDLIYGAGEIDRIVANAELLLGEWQEKERDFGQLYLEHESTTPPDSVLVEDLAVTMLVNSRVDAKHAIAVARNAAAIDLGVLPDKELGDTTSDERLLVAELIGEIANWPGMGASTATKTLHKKRPRLIPVLDNMAIFGSYMYAPWPSQPARADTVKAIPRIKQALDWIAIDVVRSENETTWIGLEEIAPARSRIELFDMVWWMYFSPRRVGAS